MGAPASVTSTTVRFSRTCFDVECVKRAAYRFLDRFALDLKPEEHELVCNVSFTPPVPEEVAEAILADFRKEVLDQDLRSRIAAETAPIRNAILALAFAPSKLQSGE